MTKQFFTASLLIFCIILISFCSSKEEKNKDKELRKERHNNEYDNSDHNEKQAKYFDIHFYKIKIEPNISERYLTGIVHCGFNILKPTQIVELDLMKDFTIKNVKGSIPVSFEHKEHKIIVKFEKMLLANSQHWIKIDYEGKPPIATNGQVKKGLIYEKHNGQPIIANLSTPFLAHYWFPCKDVLDDKADSIFVDIVLPDTTINGTPLIGVSNGILEYEVLRPGNRKTFKWKHRYPIAPCYVFVAISNYRRYTQQYTHNNVSFPLEYYVFEDHFQEAKLGVQKVPKAIRHFSNLFGNYPFQKEKFGLVQLGFYSGIEKQTSPVVNSMGRDRWYTTIHELAHAWFGNSLTCDNWQHGWLHEGFASYAEALWDEHAKGPKGYRHTMKRKAYYQGGKLYLEQTKDPFKVFKGIIYKKGAYVLHMLRGIMGDDKFFTALRMFVKENQYGNIDTERFKNICEKVSGESLDYFFEQWIHGEYFPQYSFTFYPNPKTRYVEFALGQSPRKTFPRFFRTPIRLYVQLEYKDTIIQIMNDKIYQEWEFYFTQRVKNIELDPDDWVLKDIVDKRHIKSIHNNGLEEIKVSGSLSGRQLKIIVESPKQQKINFKLQDIYGLVVLEKKLTVGGISNFDIEIPRNIQGGYYTLYLESKYEIYSKKWIITD